MKAQEKNSADDDQNELGKKKPNLTLNNEENEGKYYFQKRDSGHFLGKPYQSIRNNDILNPLVINTDRKDISNLMVVNSDFPKDSLRSPVSPRRPSLSRISRKFQATIHKNGVKPKKNKRTLAVEITLQELLFRIKLDRFVRNMRAHAGLNDFSKLTSEKLSIIDDQGASEGQILSEKAYNELLKKNEAMMKKKGSNGKKNTFTMFLNNLKQEANFNRHKFHQWSKNLYNLVEEYIPVFKPFGKFKIFWEIFLLIITVWNLFTFSLILSFQIELQEGFSFSIPFLNNERALFIFQILCFALYHFDILIKFNTSIYKDGEQVLDRKEIFKKYCSSGLIFDAMGTIPFWQSIKVQSGLSNVYLFFFLFKLYPLQIFFKNINEALLNIEGRLEAFYHLIKLLLTVLTVCHIFACLWHYQAIEAQIDTKNWIINYKLLDSNWTERYLRSLYFTVVTMTTVGYGDIAPSNSTEYLIAMACMLIGSGLIGYSINSIGAILKKKNKIELEYRNKMQLVNVYLRKNNVEEALKIKIRKYLEYIWRIENSANEKRCEEILKELPNSLRGELITQSRSWALKNLFSEHLKPETIKKLVNNLHVCTHSKEEWIFQEGDLDNSLLVIAKGSIDLILNEGKCAKQKFINLSSKKEGEIVGVTSFILDTPKKISAKASSVCTLYKLSKNKFLEIIKENAEDYETYCMIRDKMFLYNDMSVIKRKCRSCGDINHSIRYCPQLNYKPFKGILIKKYLFSIKQNRRKFKRPTRNGRNVYIKTFLDSKFVREAVQSYQELKLSGVNFLPEFYSKFLENQAGLFSGDLSAPNDDIIGDSKQIDDSKDITSASKDEFNSLDDNLKHLTQNVPFKGSQVKLNGLIFEKHREEYEDSLSPPPDKNLLHFASLPPQDLPSGESCASSHSRKRNNKPLTREDSSSANFLFDQNKMINLNPAHQTSIIKNELLVKNEKKYQAIITDPSEDMSKNFKGPTQKTINKKIPLFFYEFDVGSNFSRYFPHNNRNIVLEKRKKIEEQV